MFHHGPYIAIDSHSIIIHSIHQNRILTMKALIFDYIYEIYASQSIVLPLVTAFRRYVQVEVAGWLSHVSHAKKM